MPPCAQHPPAHAFSQCLPLPLRTTTTPPSSLLSPAGAYGLPKLLKATPGYRVYDDPEEPFSFEYPAAWVRRKNSLRRGVYISDFNVGPAAAAAAAASDGRVAAAGGTGVLLVAAVSAVVLVLVAAGRLPTGSPAAALLRRPAGRPLPPSLPP